MILELGMDLDENFENRARKIFKALEVEIGPSKMRSTLRVSKNDYLRIKEGVEVLSISGLAALSKNFDFGLEQFMNNSIDIDTVIEHAKGNKKYIQKKYSKYAFTRNITLKNVIEYLKTYFGDHFSKKVLNHFQISEEIFDSNETCLNVVFFDDLFKYLANRGIKESEIFEIGINSFNVYRKSPVFSSLSMARSNKDLFTAYFEEILPMIDKNNFYKIKKASSSKFVFESLENKDTLDMFKVKHIGSKYRCLFRSGILSSAPRHIGKENVKILEKKCVHHGDSKCQFEIVF